MKYTIFFVFLCALLSCKTTSEAPLTPPSPKVSAVEIERPKNIILLIGDGMGLTQITAGMYSMDKPIQLEYFPVVGLHKSHSADNLVTDSAAGATAFASGIKTYNGAIGVDVDTVARKTILEMAEENGLATGLISTSSITHATPASFIAHVALRTYHEDIATYFLETEIDFMMGGGKKYFAQREKDERNLYKELEAKGYQVSDFFEKDFDDLAIKRDRNFAYFTANAEPLPKSQGRDYLPFATRTAMNFLKRRGEEKGFFLMVEGSQIDWGGHANNLDYVLSEFEDFDEAIKEVLAFAKRDGETLVIVTADHETGGLAINPGSTRDSLIAAFTSTYHTAAIIPVFAYGPGAKAFRGVYENTAIFDKMKAAFGF